MSEQLINVDFYHKHDPTLQGRRLQAIMIDDEIRLEKLHEWGPQITVGEGVVNIVGREFGNRHKAGYFSTAVPMTVREIARMMNCPTMRSLLTLTVASKEMIDAWDEGRDITVDMLLGQE